MPVYRLSSRPDFPPVTLAEPGGLLAVGGDLSTTRLLNAYARGIFPWFNEGDPILWWSPDPRCILIPSEIHISRSLAKELRRGTFTVTSDRAFRDVITRCAELRQCREGTWITPEMIEAYCRLNELGYAHSVESWKEGRLAGGLYGVCLGRCFFGESMFHTETNASKVVFVTLVKRLQEAGFELVDCQMSTPHLATLGAREVPRARFLHLIAHGGVSCEEPILPGFFPSF